MDVDNQPYNEVSTLQFLRNEIFVHPKYEMLDQELRSILEGKSKDLNQKKIQITNQLDFLKSVLINLRKGLKPPDTIILPEITIYK